MSKSFIFCINRATDISLAQILYLHKPHDVEMKIVATAFHSNSEFGEWRKPKNLTRWLKNEDIKAIKEFFRGDYQQCDNSRQLKELFKKDNSVGIFPGREPFVIKDICENGAICLSAVRDYFNRFLDVHHFYKTKDIKIFLNSNAWVDEKLCERWQMYEPGINDYSQDYQYLKDNESSILFCDPYNSYKTLLDELGRDKIREQLKIPLEKKVAMVSLRRGDANLTYQKNDNNFFENTIEKMKELQQAGFYIISRRRNSVDDLVNRRVNSAENTRYQEFAKYIDLDLTGWDNFPNKIWQACYVSDLMLLADMSGICRREAVVCELPILLPKYDEEVYNRNYNNGWDPAMKDLHSRRLFVTTVEECLSEEYLKRLKEYKKMWHTGDADLFWKKLL